MTFKDVSDEDSPCEELPVKQYAVMAYHWGSVCQLDLQFVNYETLERPICCKLSWSMFKLNTDLFVWIAWKST